MINTPDFGRKKTSIIKRVCLKIARFAFCDDVNSPDCNAEISLARRVNWLFEELKLEKCESFGLVYRFEHNGVHVQLVQVSENTTHATMHFPTIGDDGKYLQCSWSFTYSKFTHFCTIIAAIRSAVLMANKYYSKEEQ